MEGMVLEKAGQSNTVNFNSEVYSNSADSLGIETRDGILFISGDVDLYVAAAFRQAGEEYVRSFEMPKIDLSGVAFLDSAGLAAILGIVRVARACEHPLHVVAVGNPRRVLRITGVDRMLMMED